MNGETFWRNVTNRMGYMRMSDLAKKTGINQSTLSNGKHKRAIPTLDHAFKIARALNAYVEDLFEASEEVRN